jgi:hypothetical protein
MKQQIFFPLLSKYADSRRKKIKITIPVLQEQGVALTVDISGLVGYLGQKEK